MSEISASNNGRIAKNTILLYGRMLLIMAVTLYTSRVVLNTLGVEDYGIYNVVGGIVTMFSFLNSAMITSTQRYLTFELGKGDGERLKLVFATSLRIHVIIALVIIFLTETIGLWFFYNKMVIPDERLIPAMWVLQISVITMIFQVMSVPYNSVIIAHESMGVFAVISILEVVLKLLVVYLLLLGNLDKLILYAVLIACVQLLVQIIYVVYCRKHFEETRSIRMKDKSLFIEMGKFAGWNVWGNLASMLMGTGVNMLLNMFFGPVVNAARAIAVQVENALNQFSTNFQLAVNPQITKLYAQESLAEMHNLIYRASKFTFFLLLAISLPVLMETETILVIWLKIVPDYTVPFLQLLLIIMLVNSTSNPLMTAAAATGNVKKYQSVIGGILLSIVPIAYFVLRMGGDPTSVYIVYLIILVIAFIARLLIVRPLIHLSLRNYFSKVVSICAFIFVLSGGTAYAFKMLLPQGVLYSVLICIISILLVLFYSYFLGLTKGEKIFIDDKIRNVINKCMH